MQTLLSLPIRLSVIVLVAWAVWAAVHPATARVQLALKGPTTHLSALSTPSSEIKNPAPPIGSMGKPLPALLFVVGAAATFYVAIEVIRFQRFVVARNQVEGLGGRMIASPDCQNLFLTWVFSTFTVDLSGTRVTDATCPGLRFIPFLKTVRFCDTNIGRGTVDELSRCRHLEAVDFSGSALNRREAIPLAKLKKLKKLLVD